MRSFCQLVWAVLELGMIWLRVRIHTTISEKILWWQYLLLPHFDIQNITIGNLLQTGVETCKNKLLAMFHLFQVWSQMPALIIQKHVRTSADQIRQPCSSALFLFAHVLCCVRKDLKGCRKIISHTVWMTRRYATWNKAIRCIVFKPTKNGWHNIHDRDGPQDMSQQHKITKALQGGRSVPEWNQWVTKRMKSSFKSWGMDLWLSASKNIPNCGHHR